MELKEKILDLLEKRNLTIKQLAEKIGMSETGFHSTLKNNTFKFETIIKICQQLGVNVSYFTENFRNEPVDLDTLIDEAEANAKNSSSEIGTSLPFELFLKSINISKEVNRKSGGYKISKAIANMYDINQFTHAYYKEYYLNYYRLLDNYIGMALMDKKSKTAISKELIPHLIEKLADPKLNPKPLIKLEKAMISFFHEIKQYVPNEDEALYEMVQEIELDLEY